MAEQPATLYCANHPDRETMLRCNRCEKPICYQCSVLTEVGYRCRECVSAQRSKYYNAAPADLPLGAVIALALGAIVGALAYTFLGAMGWFSFLIAFFIGPAVGGAIAEVIRRVLRGRRAQGMKWLAAVMFVLGILLGGFLLIGLPALLGGVSLSALLPALPRLFFRLDVLLFAGLAASTIYARLL
jgi:hypothetical protein